MNDDCKIRVVENGIIYPLSKGDNDRYDYNCEGGVTTSNGEFVIESQQLRYNTYVEDSYEAWNIAPSIKSNIYIYI